jgi:metal-responsive CopG/Arc/MetJ family transcriptional regulator
MATVNFSVPDEVKEAFDKTFGDQNKSALVADLMRRAVHEHQLQKRREQLFRQLSAVRPRRPRVSNAEIQKTRAANRS